MHPNKESLNKKNMTSIILKRRIFWIHLLFWCVYFSFFLYQISFSRFRPDRSLGELLLDTSFHIGAMMVIAYANYFFFFPRFLAHRRIGRYVMEFIVPYGLMVYLTIVGKRYIADGYTYSVHFMYDSRFTVYMIMNTLTVTLFVAMLKFVEAWLELDARRKELEHEKLSAELRFLKAQINPHFLFNTLNNLYYLAFTQSPNTPEVIAKLAQMMRYMIYDSNHPTVPLSKEIEYMENYISLEQLRLNGQIPIRLEVTGPTDRVQVAPLILITFLENAFKHGVSNNAPEAWITARLSVSEHLLTYELENSLLPNSRVGENAEKSGIGLQNVQRRLDLSYPGRYELDISQQPDRYRVALTLQWS